MPQPQLSIRSARAKILAHTIAKRERRSVSQVVELALENYAQVSNVQVSNASVGHAIETAQSKESANDFWDRIHRELYADGGEDIDLESIIQENRQLPRPIEL